LIYDSYSF